MVYETIHFTMEAFMKESAQIGVNAPGLELLNRLQTAKLLGISIALLDLKIKEQEIPVVRIGKAVRIRQSDSSAFIERHITGGK
jgi:predicted DNA-binding transcriptional regulator AlpA